jgi:phosphodiesterase/alkaline phosphatase D-like protein
LPQVSASRDFIESATGLEAGRPLLPLQARRFRGIAFSEVGSFRTAPSAGVAADLRATYTGDADGTRLAGGAPAYNDFEVLEAARLEGGDFSILNGDTIYSDSSHRSGGPATTLAEYHAAHRENRGYANLRELLATTPVYATMDDHEVANDYAGANSEDRLTVEQFLRAFR